MPLGVLKTVLAHVRDHVVALSLATYTAACEAAMVGHNTWHGHYASIRQMQRRERNPATRQSTSEDSSQM